MLGRLALGLALGLGGLASADAREPRGPVVTKPDWVRMPDADQVTRHYPHAASLLEITGRAALDCKVDSFGALSGCVVASETPRGLGFGPAALNMTPYFRMKPMSRDGRPVDGAKITIPIVFRMHPDAGPPPKPQKIAAPSPQAKRLVAALGLKEQVARSVGRAADELELMDDETTPAATRAIVAAALRKSLEVEEQTFVAEHAGAAESVFSPDELAAIAPFLESPAGAFFGLNPDRAAISEMLGRNLLRTGRIRTTEAFCRTVACDLGAVAATRVEANITAPIWSAGPDPVQVEHARPQLLRLLGSPGAARLRCRIDRLATPTDCQVAAEAPAGLGVGAAAVRLAGLLRLAPQQMAQGAEGETTAVTVIFPPADLDPPFTPPRPRSARALALARELLTRDAEAATRSALSEEGIRKQLAEAGGEADSRTLATLQAAWLEGWRVAAAEYVAGQEAAVAAIFTEEQLAAIVTFTQTPAGRALEDRRKALAKALQVVGEQSRRRFVERARTLFCQTYDCALTPAEAQPSASRNPEASIRTP